MYNFNVNYFKGPLIGMGEGLGAYAIDRLFSVREISGRGGVSEKGVFIDKHSFKGVRL